MLPIQMVDLQRQYNRLKSEIDPAVLGVMSSGAFIKGPEVKQFEKELSAYTGSAHVIGCANGTDALQIAFMALDLPPGSEIITPSFSYAALAEVLHLLKLKPVFAEVDPNTFLINPDGIEALITPNTRAIAPVHLYGQVCDMHKIMEIAKQHNLYVVEDTAQAIGAVYTFPDHSQKQAGTMGHIGTTSFFPSKNLGCFGDGGAVFTQDDELAVKISMIANHGQRVKYQHEVIGINSRLDTLQAAILKVKLNYLNEFTHARNVCADYYDKAFALTSGIQIPSRTENSTHVFHQYTVKLESKELRNGLMEELKNKGIPCMIYYPIPLHQQQAYAQTIHLNTTENLCDTVLSLPIHTEMDAEQLDFIATTINNYLDKK